MKCQEQMQKNLHNVEDGHLLSKLITTEKKTVGDNMIKVDSDHPQPLVQNNIKVYFVYHNSSNWFYSTCRI